MKAETVGKEKKIKIILDFIVDFDRKCGPQYEGVPDHNIFGWHGCG